MRPLIFVVSGPSGSGKSTLLSRLVRSKDLKNKLVKSISLTTRPKRSAEKDGRDYFFISEEDFRKIRKAKKILEWTRYLGYYYTTPKEFVERQLVEGKNLILCLDSRGALKIRQLYPQNTITIFILPPSLGALKVRIKKRCHKTEKQEIQKRLQLAKEELRVSRRYDYCLVNQDLADTVKKLKDIVLRKTTSKRR